MAFEEVNDLNEINDWLAEYKLVTCKKAKAQLRNLITTAYLPFVKKISHGLARRSTDPVEDLVQVGSVGLLKAIEQYDSTQGSSFKTYSTYLITGEIRHYLRDKSAMIRAPRELQELSFRINQLVQNLTSKLGKTPSELEISRELQIPVSKLDEISQVDRRKQLVSLDAVCSTNNDNDQSLNDKLVDSKYQDFLKLQEDRIMLNEAVESLEEQLKLVIKKRFFEDKSQNEIAQELGISQMQVSRKIKKALNELFNIISTQKKSESAIS